MAADGKIFISYRRADALGIAGRIRDKLISELGSHRVYFDFDSIPLGLDFRVQLDELIADSEYVLVVIGPSWETAADSRGHHLDHDDDWVRVEIQAALKREIPVVPVLVGGATMPSSERLPEAIRDLAFRNWIVVRDDPDFHTDMARLIEGLPGVRTIAAGAPGQRRTRRSTSASNDSTSVIVELDRASRLDPFAALDDSFRGRLPLLQRGSGGAWVEYLQQRLLAAGADLDPFGADGQFGSVTREAVIAFQRRAGIDADGIVGPDTWNSVLSSDPAAAPTIGLESGGAWVEYLQQRLLAAGADLDPFGADGQFGSVTREAVIAFQRRAGIDADGIVGPDTWEAILR